METFKLPKLDYAGKDIEESLGLTTKESHYVRASLIFECLACPMMAEEFFSKPQDVPVNLISMPGIMERCFTHVRNGVEQFYLSTIFLQGFAMVQSILEHTREHGFGDTPPQIVIDMMQNQLQAPVETIGTVIKRIKASNFSFDEFISLTVPEDRYDALGNFVPIEVAEEDVEGFLEDLKKKYKKKKDEEGEEPADENNN